MKIAVIDDELGVRDMLRDVLEMDGHQVFDAEDGDIGLDLIKAKRPDLIICDISMPKMSGDELFERLQHSDPELGMIPFIFLSGNATKDEQIKRLNGGASNCFRKPVDLMLLAAHVNSMLSGVSRTSSFFNAKFDAIFRALSDSADRHFNVYVSLCDSQVYVDAIIDAIKNFSYQASSQQENSNKYIAANSADSHDQSGVSEKCLVDYVDFCLAEFEKRDLLVNRTNGEDISWMIIFLAAKSQLAEEKLYISDLYVSLAAARSTVNSRITNLIDDGVLEKISDSSDKRRQVIILSRSFLPKFQEYISDSIELIRRTV
ncbi:MAG: response regulator [Gammaproteobacteria bacterium]|nr:response regulator [Gammaproteobacteria bacterium]